MGFCYENAHYEEALAFFVGRNVTLPFPRGELVAVNACWNEIVMPPLPDLQERGWLAGVRQGNYAV